MPELTGAQRASEPFGRLTALAQIEAKRRWYCDLGTCGASGLGGARGLERHYFTHHHRGTEHAS